MWGAPGNLAAADIASYTLTWSSGSSSFGPLVLSGLSTSFTGLTNGAPYTFTVAATSVDGVTGPATSSVAVTPSGTPRVNAPAVSIGTPNPAGFTNVQIDWTADPNGSPIIDYTVSLSPVGDRVVVAPATSTGFKLDYGSYSVTVTARNANGTTTSVPIPINLIQICPCT
jgi:hypothetical protein